MPTHIDVNQNQNQNLHPELHRMSRPTTSSWYKLDQSGSGWVLRESGSSKSSSASEPSTGSENWTESVYSHLQKRVYFNQSRLYRLFFHNTDAAMLEPRRFRTIKILLYPCNPELDPSETRQFTSESELEWNDHIVNLCFPYQK